MRLAALIGLIAQIALAGITEMAPAQASDPAIRVASKVLPRIDGSSTIWLSDASVFVPSGRSRLTRTVTFHKPVMLPSHQFVGTATAHAAETQLEAYYEGYRRSVAHLYE